MYICLSKPCVTHCPQGTYTLRSREVMRWVQNVKCFRGVSHAEDGVYTAENEVAVGHASSSLIILAVHWIHKAAEWIISLEKGIYSFHWELAKLLHRLCNGEEESVFFSLFWFPRTFSGQSGIFFFLVTWHVILVPWPGLNCALHWKHGVSTTDCHRSPSGQEFDNDDKHLTINISAWVHLINCNSSCFHTLLCSTMNFIHVPLIAGYHNDLCPCSRAGAVCSSS